MGVSLVLVPVAQAVITPQEKVDYYAEQTSVTQAAASTLLDMLKYFDTAIALNAQDSQRLEQTIEHNNAKIIETQKPPRSRLAGLTWNELLAFPFESIWYFIKQEISPAVKPEPELPASLTIARQKENERLTSNLTDQLRQLELLKTEKTYLLSITQNDEQKYQGLLTSARQELAARRAIISDKSSEREVGVVERGSKIATIISGSSVCSTGTHLHFEVRQDNIAVDPANYLSAASVRWAIAPVKPVVFSGSWSWPVATPLVATQEFGMSWFAKPGGYSTRGAYNGASHTGLDMVSDGSSLDVLAPINGTLFTGNIACGGGTLSYVRLQQSPTLSMYFLHAAR